MLRGGTVALGTMHEKERVIAPVLHDGLGLEVVVPAGLDTDVFGTFTREVRRDGTALDAARAKARAALDRTPSAHIGVASEGCFGPHPYLPFVAGGREIVLMIEPEEGLELVGRDLTHETNYASAQVRNVLEALSFAEKVRFPTHAIVAMAVEEGRPAPHLALYKGITTPTELFERVRELFRFGESVHLESDMRAHVNPTRMRAIRRATLDLLHRIQRRCPRCKRPGFDVRETRVGLPCGDCGERTLLTRSEVYVCTGCDYREERAPSHGRTFAPPSECPECNP